MTLLQHSYYQKKCTRHWNTLFKTSYVKSVFYVGLIRMKKGENKTFYYVFLGFYMHTFASIHICISVCAPILNISKSYMYKLRAFWGCRKPRMQKFDGVRWDGLLQVASMRGEMRSTFQRGSHKFLANQIFLLSSLQCCEVRFLKPNWELVKLIWEIGIRS